MPAKHSAGFARNPRLQASGFRLLDGTFNADRRQYQFGRRELMAGGRR
jgi:hypothetical protein